MPGLDHVKPLFFKGKIGLIVYSREVGSSAGKTLAFLQQKYPDIPVFRLSGKEDMMFFTNNERIKILGFKRSPLTDEIVSRLTAYWSADGEEV